MLDALFKSAVHAIIVIDKDGAIHAVNPAAVAMFGQADDELQGQNVRSLMPEPSMSAARFLSTWLR